MSEFTVEVVRIGPVSKHPNADTLSITHVRGDYPVIFRTGDFNENDLAVYVPVDAVVPQEEQWAFLGEHRRIKAKRLRGVFSMGLLSPALPEWKEGDNVQELLRIQKYEPAIHLDIGENETDPGFLPVYTDIEGLRRHRNVLIPGEEVVLTEKIHGANGRFLFHEDRLWVGSHKMIKRESDTNMWWRVAKKENLALRLNEVCPGLAIYGEVYGQVQDLKYGIEKDVQLILFDALNVKTRTYLDYDDFISLAASLGMQAAPLLYRGPWDQEKLAPLANGKSTMLDATHCREGFVVRPVKERVEHMGRVILKMIGEDYLLRKNA